MSIIFVMQGKCLFSDISRPESGVAKMAWDVMSGVTKMAWDVMSGVTKTAWDVLSGVANLCGMFCPGCKKWHGMFCPGMFCPAPVFSIKLTFLIAW